MNQGTCAVDPYKENGDLSRRVNLRDRQIGGDPLHLNHDPGGWAFTFTTRMVRFKNRWLLIEFIPFTSDGVATYAPSSEGLTSKHVWNALRDSVIHNFGDTGWGAVGSSLTVKYFSPTTNLCIVRVGRDHHRIAWGAVTCIRKLQGRAFLPNVIHVSGTIKHAQLAAIQHNREAVARLRAQSKLPAMYQSKYDEYLESSSKEIEALRD